MKKSSFTAMFMGTISGLLFALGMCMALIPEWNAFREGVIFGCIGIAAAVITLMVWRKMEHKSPIRVNARAILTVVAGGAGALVFGIGMCFSMVWGNLISGILIGVVGILILLTLIPLIKGIH